MCNAWGVEGAIWTYAFAARRPSWREFRIIVSMDEVVRNSWVLRIDRGFQLLSQNLRRHGFQQSALQEQNPNPPTCGWRTISIPNMGFLLRPYFQDVKPIVIADSGHFVPEEQPEALAKALLAFL